MSDIQSISNGTYVIGQTSATNFIGGPGIKVDSPSAGTVRIGNDETVLWSGSSNLDTSIQLSESTYNFNSVRILYRNNDQFGGSVDVMTNPSGNVNFTSLMTITPIGNGYTYLKAMAVQIDAAGTTITKPAPSLQLRWNTTGGSSPSFNSSSGNNITLHKVIGINRISGSNA